MLYKGNNRQNDKGHNLSNGNNSKWKRRTEMSEATRTAVASLLKGIDRYNPENLLTLERHVSLQVRDNTYDLEANLAVLKLYQFNPKRYNRDVTAQILLKALTNLPHTDFTLCRCLIDSERQKDPTINKVIHLAKILEMCEFQFFWDEVAREPEVIYAITGFEDSIRKFICHVVGITYQTVSLDTLSELLGGIPEHEVHQWISKYGWSLQERGNVFIAPQDEIIKPKNIMEKITFDSVSAIMAASR